MLKGDRAKLQLMLQGIRTRLEQNRAFFLSTEMTFRSGGKTFLATLLPEGKLWSLRFQGVGRTVDAKQAMEFFSEQILNYQEGALTYKERAQQIVITCSTRGVQMKQTDKPSEECVAGHIGAQPGRQYLIRVDKAAPLLREIGILAKNGKIKNDMIRKYNQIDHYVELVAPMFEKDDSREIILLDCACGKSYLSFVMNYYICEVLKRRCQIIGIDIQPHVIEESRKLADRLGYHNMEFQQADLREYVPPKNVTAVISLHACDIATDLALATAIRARAKYIACVPCCHKELLEQYHLPELAPLTRHGVFQARFNDVLTDSLRALKLEAEGYKVSVVEYISPLDSPKNLLIRATRISGENPQARQEYEQVRKALGTTSELDRRCAEHEDCFFLTDDDLQQV